MRKASAGESSDESGAGVEMDAVGASADGYSAVIEVRCRLAVEFVGTVE
jgi:hypothetical protein